MISGKTICGGNSAFSKSESARRHQSQCCTPTQACLRRPTCALSFIFPIVSSNKLGWVPFHQRTYGCVPSLPPPRLVAALALTSCRPPPLPTPCVMTVRKPGVRRAAPQLCHSRSCLGARLRVVACQCKGGMTEWRWHIVCAQVKDSMS
jgi:hypothetical protein